MIGELHTQIVLCQHNLALARQAGLSYEAHLHHARLEDLIDMAALHGIDTSAWLGCSMLPRVTGGTWASSAPD